MLGSYTRNAVELIPPEEFSDFNLFIIMSNLNVNRDILPLCLKIKKELSSYEGQS